MNTIEDIIRIATVNQTLLAGIMIKLGFSKSEVDDIVNNLYEHYDKVNKEGE